MQPLNPYRYTGGPVTTEDVPTGITSWRVVPPAPANNLLSKRVKEFLRMRPKSAAVLNRKWDQSVHPTIDPGNGSF